MQMQQGPAPAQGNRNYLTAAEFANRLNVHENTVRNMLAAGEVQALRFRRCVRIPIVEVERFEREHMMGSTAKH